MSNNLSDSLLLKGLNGFLSCVQKRTAFFFEGSLLYKFFVQNIDKFINFLAFLLLFLSIFANSETLGLVVFLGFFALVSKYLFIKGCKVEVDFIDLIVIVYLMFFTIASLWSSWLFDSLHGLIKTYTYFFAYLVFKDILKTKPSKKPHYIGFLACLCVVEAFVCLQQQFVGVEAISGWQDMSNIDPSQAMTRVFGTLKPLNPNLMAGYFIATFPCVLGLCFYNFKDRFFNILGLLINKNLLFAFFAILVFLSIIFTGCRGSYIALFWQLALFVFLSYFIIWNDFSENKQLKNIWKILVGVGCFLGFLGVFCSESLQTRIMSIFSPRGDSSNSFRMNVYQSSFNMLKDNWLLGIGAGNWTFREVYGLYMKTGFDALGAYSVFLEIAVETGVFGLLNFILLLFFSLKRGIDSFLEGAYNSKILIAVPIFAIIGMMIHGIIDTVWFRPQLQFVFWLMVAFLGTENEGN